MTRMTISAKVHQEGLPLMLCQPIYSLLSKLKNMFPHFVPYGETRKNNHEAAKIQKSSIATAVKNKHVLFQSHPSQVLFQN